MKKHALFLILFAALAASAFCQGTEAVKVYSSGTDKGKFVDGSLVETNGLLRASGGTATDLTVIGPNSTIVIPGVLDTTTGVLGGGDSIINWYSGFLGWDSETVLDWQTRRLHGVWQIDSQYSDEIVIPSGPTPTWDLNSGIIARFTATSDATFTISNMQSGQFGTLTITQVSGTAPYTITFPAGVKSPISGTNTYTMSGTNVFDILFFFKTGTNTVITGQSVHYAP
jgi:hypothetical protein